MLRLCFDLNGLFTGIGEIAIAQSEAKIKLRNGTARQW
jgi:hypothetical protein